MELNKNEEKIYEVILNSDTSHDSRIDINGNVYVAIKGENHNGNDFVQDALGKGALACLVDDLKFKESKDEKIFYVEDVVNSLGKIAKLHRRSFDIPVIAITGSNGKTTTKELLYECLSVKYKVHRNNKNYNNKIGVPLAILRMTKDAEIAVFEIGASEVGEIKNLSEMVQPTHGIITNIGNAHVGTFGGFDSLVKEKAELFNYLEKNNGTVFVLEGDSLLEKLSENLKREFYKKVEIVDQTPCLVAKINGRHIKTKMFGEYNSFNIGAALKVSENFNVDENDAIKAIENYIPLSGRSEIVETKNNLIISEAYNANKESIIVSVESFSKLKSDKQKIVILGDIFDLEEYAEEQHREVLENLKKYNFEKIYLAGSHFMSASKDFEFTFFETTEDLVKELKEKKITNYLILIKASNGMNFKRLLEEGIL